MVEKLLDIARMYLSMYRKRKWQDAVDCAKWHGGAELVVNQWSELKLIFR